MKVHHTARRQHYTAWTLSHGPRPQSTRSRLRQSPLGAPRPIQVLRGVHRVKRIWRRLQARDTVRLLLNRIRQTADQNPIQRAVVDGAQVKLGPLPVHPVPTHLQTHPRPLAVLCRQLRRPLDHPLSLRSQVHGHHHRMRRGPALAPITGKLPPPTPA